MHPTLRALDLPVLDVEEEGTQDQVEEGEREPESTHCQIFVALHTRAFDLHVARADLFKRRWLVQDPRV